jgi:hypothetical protein
MAQEVKAVKLLPTAHKILEQFPWGVRTIVLSNAFINYVKEHKEELEREYHIKIKF